MNQSGTTSKIVSFQYKMSKELYAEYFLNYPVRGIDQDFEYELPNLQQALYCALELENKEKLPTFWNGVKDFLMDKGFWILFTEWGEAILGSIRHLNDLETEAWLLADLGWLCMEKGEFSVAQARFEHARNNFENLGHQFGMCVLERYLGVVAYRSGNLEKASAQYKKAEKLALARNYQGMIAEIKNLQGSLARKKGDYTDSRRLYHESIQTLEKLDDAWRLTAVLRNLARLEFQVGNLIDSKIAFNEVIKLCQQLGRKDMLYGCYLRLAEVELRLENLSAAVELATEAKRGFIELGLNRDINEANLFLTELRSQIGK